jgi:heat shock protein HtpX
MNAVKTAFLMVLLTVILVLVGTAIGGRSGSIFALCLAAVFNFIGYWTSDKIALAMHRAKALEPGEAPELEGMVRELAMKASIPMPRLYVIPQPAPNAFATGRDPAHAAVAVTEGALRALKPEELRGVLAHELGHVIHRDILVATIAATMAGAITMLATWARWAAIFGGLGGRDGERRGGGLELLLMAIVAPIAALLVQMAVSRSREFMADEASARLTRDPLALAGALRRLEAYSRQVPLATSPSSAHMFIVNPLHGGFAGLFSTHPPTEARIQRLEAMVGHV